MKKANKVIANATAKLAYNSAKHSANSACAAFFGQAKLPEKVKKMRKF
ncbi:cyclic lactone autoinducer peptide [bacterium]|nr:cyclic lactone autoinducer peptide [bacterium]